MKTKAERQKELNDLKRGQLDKLAKKIGLDPKEHSNKKVLAYAVLNKEYELGEIKVESESPTNVKELPAYESVKKVRALKIKEVRRNSDGTAEITPEEKGYEPFTVSSHYMRRHNARAGGYYIVYENGTPSFQAAVFFEEGYQKVK